MKHLHLQFILASLGLGLGFLFVVGAVWQMQLTSALQVVTVGTMGAAILSSAAGIVLVAFGVHGIRQEMYGHKK